MIRLVLPLLLMLVFAHQTVRADELRTVDGKSVSGTLLRIAEGEIVLKGESGEVGIPLAQVLALDVRPARSPDSSIKYTMLRLLDDTTLACKGVVFRGKEVEATLLSGFVVKLPVNSVVSLLADAANRDFQKRWSEIASPKIKRDRIVIVRDGEANVIEGALGDADADGKTIQFRLDGTDKSAPVLLDRIHALVFWRPDPSPETPICKVIDRDGNTIYAVKLGLDEDVLAVQTTFGAKLAFKSEMIAKLDFNLGKLTYLSDMDPAKVFEKSGIGLVVRYRKDVNLDGEPILLDSKQYPKGLSMHAHTELEYNLAGKFKDLKGILGVDTRIGADSQAVVTIFCDGEKRFSEVVTPKAQRPVALVVKDVQTLKIVVSSRNFLDLHDHVTFAEARVSQ